MKVPNVFVNHVTKTAGTSLFELFEPYYKERDVLTSYHYEQIGIQSSLLNTGLHFLNRTFVQTHVGYHLFKNYFRTHMLVSTLRKPIERMESAVSHTFSSGGDTVTTFLTTKNFDSLDDLFVAYFNSTQFSMFLSDNINIKIDDFYNKTDELLAESLKALSESAIIIDMHNANADFNSLFGKSITRNTKYDRNAQDVYLSIDSIDKVFPKILELELKFYEKAQRLIDESRPNKILNEYSNRTTVPINIITFNDVVDYDGLSKRELVQYPGWSNVYSRFVLNSRFKISNIKMGSNTVILMFFWSPDINAINNTHLLDSTYVTHVASRFIDRVERHSFCLEFNCHQDVVDISIETVKFTHVTHILLVN